MKTSEEVKDLAEGDILYDKAKKDKEGNPYIWKVIGPFYTSRRVPDHFIRQLELQTQLDPEKEDKSYYVLSNENMEDLVRNENVARLYHILWEMEDGFSSTLWEKFRIVTSNILKEPTLATKIKDLDLF